MTIDEMIDSSDDVRALKSMLKNPIFALCRGRIESRIAVLQPKPQWKPKKNLTKEGGLILPKAVYLDGLDALRALLDDYESDVNACKFPVR